MATLSQLAVSNLALKGAGVDYNYLNRFFETKAEADAALADNSWTPEAGRLNACLTGDQGLLVYNETTSSLDVADGATRAYIDSQISSLVDGSPETLDTLNELAAALNDDPAYFTNAEAARQANTNLINAETARATAAEATIQADVDQNEADADAAIAAVQADVDQNEADADAAIAAVQADVDQNEADADAAIAAVQADVDQNEADADAADAALSGRLDVLEADPTTATAVAAVQADVDQNEADADAADAALSGRLDVLEADPTTATAVAAVQADVDQNEADSDAADAALSGRLDVLEADPTTATALAAVQADVDQNEADADAAIAAVQADVDQNEADADAALELKAPLESPALTGTPTAPTAAQASGTTQIATTAYVDTAVANLIDTAPGALDTLNELAAAVGDDANFSTTITNSITAVQNDVNQNEIDSDAADAALSGRLDVLEADPTTATAVAAVQADVDQNEADADAAIAAVQADVDQNEADADAADAALGVRIDNVETEIDTARTNIYTAIGQSEGAQSMGTFTGSTLGDNQNIKQLLQTLETATEGEISARTAIAEFVSNLTRLKNDLRGTYINVGNNIELRPAPGGRVEIVGDLYLDNNTAIDGNGTILTSFANINAYDGRLNVLEADPTTATAVAAVQADVDQNEADADAAIAAVQADVDQNEADADAAIAAVQADVDQNEADADAAIALKADIASPTFTGTPAAPTASAGTNTTQLATTAFVSTAVANLVDGAPGAIDTLNELAAALGDDANFSTTVTNSIAAVQADVDQNEVDSDAADAALSGRLDVLEADPTTATAVAAVQADVDQNEADADAAIAAVQADVDQNEADADAAIAAVQADVDQNEADADAADAALSGRLDVLEADATTATAVAAVQADVDQNEADADAAIAAVQADVDQNEADADAAIAANEVHIDNLVTLTGVSKDSTNLGTFSGTTISDSRTLKLALQDLETALENKANISFVQNEIADVIDGAPGALNTLNEIAAAMGDDENLSVTLTNLINANETHVDNMATLTGVAKDSTNLGTFTGGTINDNQTIKQALQALETQVEATQADVDQNESDADAAIAAVQADVDQNEADADAADAALSGRLDTLEADPTTATAVAAVQADVDQNEADADAADAALSGRLDVLEADPTTATAVAAVQADVDQNEADADAADAALSGRLDVLEADPTTATAVAAVQADVDQNEADADAAIAAILAGTSIPGPYNNDGAAATGGVAVGAIYKNSNGTIHWRVS